MDREKDFINKFKEALGGAAQKAKDARMEDERRRVMSTLGQDMAKMMAPFLKNLAESAKMNKEDVREVMQELAATVNAREMPGIDTGAIQEAIYVAFGNIRMPEPKVTVISPKIDFPPLAWPKEDMSIKGWVRLMGVDMENPLPVQLRDAKGRPVDIGNVGAAQILGGNSAKHDFFTVKGITASVAAAIVDASGAAYSGSNPFPVTITSGGTATSGSAIVDSTGVQYSGSNPIPVVITSGGTATSASNIVDSSGVAYSGSNPLPVTGTVTVSGITATIAVSNVDSSGVQYSGSNPMPVVIASGAGATQGAALIDSSGVQYSGSNPLPITGSVVVSSVTATVAVLNVDSSGVGYSGSNPLPITGAVTLSGSLSSSVVTGPSVTGTADDGTAGVQGAGIARTTNPSKVSDGQVVKKSMDAVGRQLMRSVQVRELLLTAYVSISNGTETTLLAAQAGFFTDLVFIKGGNNSDAVAVVDIRSVTTGSIVDTLIIPPYGTAGVAPNVPYPQSSTGNNWTVDMPDTTGTTVYVTALFSKEL